MTNDTAKIRESAYRLLARREHSYKELQTKLKQREFDRDAIDAVLQDLIDEGLQSDARFAESYIRMRAMNGFGPERIPLELAERGVGQSLIDNAMANTEIDWQEYADTVYEK